MVTDGDGWRRMATDGDGWRFGYDERKKKGVEDEVAADRF